MSFLKGLRERLRSAGYLAEDALHGASRVLRVIARVPRALGRGAREFWFSLNIYSRRRLTVVAGVLAVVIAVWLVAIPALPCSFPGGDTCPPGDDAIELVPRDALAYAHVDLGSSTDQYQAATGVAARLPTLTQVATAALLSQIPGPGGRQVDFAGDVEPWFSGEAAIAIVPGSGRAAEEVQLLEVSDEKGAEKFARSLAGGTATKAKYHGVDVSVDARGLATALTGGFLAIGTERGVDDVIDAETGAGGARSLADSPDADAALAGLPDERLADAYLSPAGIGELISHPGGLLSQFAPLVDPGASRGVGVALVAGDDGLEIEVRSVLDPKRSKASPSFFAAFPPFKETLAAGLPTDTLAYLGVGDPGGALRSLIEQATSEQPGLAAAFTALVKQVSEVGGVNLERDLLPSLGDEAAFALQPAPPRKGGGAGSTGAGEQSPSVLTQPGTPFLELVASGVDEQHARDALARLEAPIARALNPDQGLQAPSFSSTTIAKVDAQSLQLTPTVDLTYSVFDGLLVIATDPTGVEQIASGSGGLSGSDRFGLATDGFPDRPSLLAYVDLQGLLSLAEGAGLAADPAYATFASDVRRLQALGLAVESRPDLLSTDLRLIVGDAADTAGTGAPQPTD